MALNRSTGMFSRDDLRRKIASLEKEVAEAKALADNALAGLSLQEKKPQARQPEGAESADPSKRHP